MIAEIIGSKSKIALLQVLFNNLEACSMHSLSREAKIPYSVVHRDIKILRRSNFILTEKKKGKTLVKLNRTHHLYDKINALLKQETKKEWKIIEQFKNKDALIIIHHNADLDAVGSAIALARGLFQKKIRCNIFAPAGISAQSRQVLEKYPYPVLEKIGAFTELIFVVDASSKEQLADIEVPEKSKLFVIDHHLQGNLSKIADYKIIDGKAHSTALLVYNFLIELEVEITYEISFFLLSGLVAETSHFTLVNEKDLELALKLMNFVEIERVRSALAVEQAYSEKIANLKALKRAKVYKINNKLIIFSRVGSYEAAVARNLLKLGADISIVENVKLEDVRISGRCKSNLNVDLALVFKKIETLIEGSAGGHPTAASANGKNASNVENARRLVINELERLLRGKAVLLP